MERKPIERALARLVARGLVDVAQGRCRLATEQILFAARKIAESRRPAGTGDVLSRFMSKGRLNAIPAARSKRLIALDRLAQEFEPGRRYREPDVNATLRRYHDDVAALRRYLVDEGFMSRDHGIYWRSGGSFPVD
jgi:hypothetical protein